MEVISLRPCHITHIWRLVQNVTSISCGEVVIWSPVQCKQWWSWLRLRGCLVLIRNTSHPGQVGDTLIRASASSQAFFTTVNWYIFVNYFPNLAGTQMVLVEICLLSSFSSNCKRFSDGMSTKLSCLCY